MGSLRSLHQKPTAVPPPQRFSILDVPEWREMHFEESYSMPGWQGLKKYKQTGIVNEIEDQAHCEFILKSRPIMPGTVQIQVISLSQAGKIVRRLRDGGKGRLLGRNTTGTIDYKTGLVRIVFVVATDLFTNDSIHVKYVSR
jgi:hypothetical protein